MSRRRAVLGERAGDQRAQGQAQGGEGAGYQRGPLASRWLQIDQRGPIGPVASPVATACRALAA